MSAGAASHGRAVRAEAASWVARLHGPDRNADMEAGFKRWLTEDRDHASAFELATEIWLETADLPGRLACGGTRRKMRNANRSWRPLLAAAAVALLAIAVVFLVREHRPNSTLVTAIGEQRTMTLKDGTRVQLNTSTELAVRYDEDVRKVVLNSGEAWFDVAKNSRRPFIVTAGEQTIVALGTSFVVQQENSGTTVILLEGKVAVSPDESVPFSSQRDHTTVLAPGQRLHIATRVGPRAEEAVEAAVIDTPSLEKVTAWQRGQVVFEDTPLNEAADEINRYSEIKIRLGQDGLAKIRVGGTFRVGDIDSFARAIATYHHLQVVNRDEQVILTK